MNLDLTGKRALVCGGSQGIGKASARELALLGASLTLIARNEEKLKVVVAELPATQSQQHNYIVADFDQSDDLRNKIELLTKAADIHILVNNTGGPPAVRAIDAPASSFVSSFSNHLVCSHILVQALYPAMKRAAYGRIINIISTSVKIPIRGLGVSNTVRGAVANWSKTLASELAPFGITVNNVLPGSTRTHRLDSIIQLKAEQTGRSHEDIKGEMIRDIPVGRISEPEEVGAVVAFLASPAAGYINGINLPVDGGRTGSL